jgi:cytochrome c oxidase cbb3-type subunit 1
MTDTIIETVSSELAAKAFAFTSALWFALATSFGMIAAGYVIAPDFMANIEFIQFGRARPIHVNLVLFGFVTPGLISAAYYFTPRLLRTELYSQKLGVVTAVLWNLTLVAAVISLGLGYSQGREYAELPWAVDMMIIGIFALAPGQCDLAARQRRPGGDTGCHPAVVLRPQRLRPAADPLSAGVAYYVHPQGLQGSPLYSHTLSLLGFWSLIVVYTHIGTHHLLQVPVPTWLKVISIVDSVAMVIPVMAFLINIWYTAKGKLGRDSRRHRGQVCLHRHHHVLFRQHPGSLHGAAPGAAGHPFQQLGGGPRPRRRAGICRHDRPGRALLHPAQASPKNPCYSRFLADFQYWMVLIGHGGPPWC